jgi:uncharacterized protein (DUF849 family)
MEDVLTYSRGVPVRDNAQLVARAADAATLFQRPPMSTDDARAMLRIRPLGEQAPGSEQAGRGGGA